MAQTTSMSASGIAAVTARPAEPMSLLDVRIDHGPADLIDKFFLMADFALRQHGVHLTFGSFDDIIEINAANHDSWLPVVPTFDKRFGLLDPANAFVIVGRNRQGNPVTVGAMRIFDWHQTNFKTEAESLRLFFADPTRMAEHHERCEVVAPMAATLSGLVAFSGAGWFHPSVRGRLLGALLSRVSRAYAYTRWQTDLSMAVMSKRLISKGWAIENGYQHVEPGFALRNFVLGDYDGGVVWVHSGEFLDDLEHFTIALERELGEFERLDRAQHKRTIAS